MPEPRRTRPGRFCGYALRVGDADYLSTPSVADFPASRDREDGFLEPGRSGPMELVFAPGGTLSLVPPDLSTRRGFKGVCLGLQRGRAKSPVREKRVESLRREIRSGPGSKVVGAPTRVFPPCRVAHRRLRA